MTAEDDERNLRKYFTFMFKLVEDGELIPAEKKEA